VLSAFSARNAEKVPLFYCEDAQQMLEIAGCCRRVYPEAIYPYVIWCGQHMLASRRLLERLGWMEPTCRHRQDAAKCRTELKAWIADANVEND